MNYKYTKCMLFLTVCGFLLTACSSDDLLRPIDKKKEFQKLPKYTIQVKYGNEDWITYNNVISIRKPDRYRNVLTIVLDDDTRIHTIGAIARWTDKIPEYY